jgi:hypothetical protein
MLEPTIITGGADRGVVVYVPGPNPGEKALLVFCTKEEAEDFRASTGELPTSEGFRTERLDPQAVARVCAAHDLWSVAMPGLLAKGETCFFNTWDFVEILGKYLSASA